MLNQCFFKRLMRPPILMNVHLLEVKKTEYINSCWVKETSEELWRKGKGNRLPTERKYDAGNSGGVWHCSDVILVV